MTKNVSFIIRYFNVQITCTSTVVGFWGFGWGLVFWGFLFVLIHFLNDL